MTPGLDWAAVEAMLDGILARRFYTNQGPLACELERRLALAHGAAHAIAVTNPAIARAMLQEVKDGWGAGPPALLVLPLLPGGPAAAAILTDDAALAARLRNIRSSYGAGAPAPVVRTANGRLSEAQAGIALLLLDAGAAGAA